MEHHGEGSNDSSLDFLSPDFDPRRVLALSPSKVQLPCPSVQPCDNLDTYDSIVLGTKKTFDAGVTVKDVGEDSGREVGVAFSQQPTIGSVDHKLPEAWERSYTYTRVRKQPRNVLTFMDASGLGPISLLQRCHRDQDRVRVLVRHCAGVRGVCEGVVLAFDKHMNLVLGDVYEEYTPFRTIANGGKMRKKKKKKKKRQKEEDFHPESETPRSSIAESSTGGETLTTAEAPSDSITNRAGDGDGEVKVDCAVATEERLCRRLNQLFIRGDNVVMVVPTGSPGDKDSTTPTGEDRDFTTVTGEDKDLTTPTGEDRDFTTPTGEHRDLTTPTGEHRDFTTLTDEATPQDNNC